MANKFIVWSSIAVIGYLALGSTTSVSIDRDTCEPKGFIATFRRGVNPQGFYKDQIGALDSEIQKINKTIRVREQVKNYENSVSPIIEADANRKMEEIYQKHPSLRPSYQETQAQRLREKADSLEEEALFNKMDQMAFTRIAQYEYCKNNLALRLK